MEGESRDIKEKRYKHNTKTIENTCDMYVCHLSVPMAIPSKASSLCGDEGVVTDARNVL